MPSQVQSFVTVLAATAPRRARRTPANACVCREGILRVGSTACVAFALAHVLTACPPSLAQATGASTAGTPSPATTAADSGARVESETELRARSVRNTRTSGAASRLFARATRAASGGDLRGAEALYAELVAAAPEFAPAHSNLGNVLVARGAYSDAVGEYSRALALAPRARDTWLVLVNRAAARLALADPRGALADLDEALELAPATPPVLAVRGKAWEALGKYESAIRDYQNALRGNEVQPFWLRYGLVLFERGKSFEAVSILNRVAARIGGDDVAAAQAVVLFDRGELGMAEDAWSRVERPRMYESRAFLERERMWPPKAVAAMERFRGLK